MRQPNFEYSRRVVRLLLDWFPELKLTTASGDLTIMRIDIEMRCQQIEQKYQPIVRTMMLVGDNALAIKAVTLSEVETTVARILHILNVEGLKL